MTGKHPGRPGRNEGDGRRGGSSRRGPSGAGRERAGRDRGDAGRGKRGRPDGRGGHWVDRPGPKFRGPADEADAAGPPAAGGRSSLRVVRDGADAAGAEGSKASKGAKGAKASKASKASKAPKGSTAARGATASKGAKGARVPKGPGGSGGRQDATGSSGTRRRGRVAPGARRARRPGSRASGRPARRRGRNSEAVEELRSLAGRRSSGAVQALLAAADAYRGDREREAARLLRPLRDAYPDAAGVRELLGLAQYRLGHYVVSARELEAFVELTGSCEQHPVLMDCYRAQRRYGEIAELWDELKTASPSAELVAEGRIVAAGALADQGRFADGIRLLERRGGDVRDPRLHHLRMWYALGDLLERAGDLPAARARFERIRRADPGFADVAERLAALA